MAWDIGFSGLDPTRAAETVRQWLGAAPMDVAAQPLGGRRKKLLIADMESTIIENEMLDELADLSGIEGLGERIASITHSAMNGEIDFAGAIRDRVALLKGLPAAILDAAAARITITPGAATLVRTMAAHGAKTALVSGGFGVFTALIRGRLGFDFDQAISLEVRDGRLTGRVEEPILARDAKCKALNRLAEEHHLPLSATLTVGDGANDLDMLAAAGIGVAYHAKPMVAATAPLRIEHADLTALLFVQGYHAGQFRS